MTRRVAPVQGSGRPAGATRQTGAERAIRVISIDPGITTGIAIAQIHADNVVLSCDEAKYSHSQFWELLHKVRPDFIVCERFDFRNRQRDNLELFSRELIGVVRLYAELNPECCLKMQTAAQGKVYTDNMLHKEKVYRKGKGHGRDAVRHFLQWFHHGPGYQFNINTGLPITLAQEAILLESLAL